MRPDEVQTPRSSVRPTRSLEGIGLTCFHLQARDKLVLLPESNLVSQMRVTSAISFDDGQDSFSASIPCDVLDGQASGGGPIARLALGDSSAINVARRIR